MIASSVWRFAFRRWARAFFGADRWDNHGIDRDWVQAYKAGFRAGWRARGKSEGSSDT